MAKKMRTLFKHKNPSQHKQTSVSSSSSSQSACREQTKTLSFRAATSGQPSSKLTQYLGDEDAEDLESVVIRSVRTIKSSERLFFSPEKTNSILKKKTSKSEHHRPKLLYSTASTTQAENHNTINISEPMISITTTESLDPYMDFRSSMEEMVEAHGLHDWDLLEELLGCYLMLNDTRNHCHIIRAFADLVLLIKSSHFVLHQLTTTSSDLASNSCVTSFSSPLHLSSCSTTAETSCSSSSIALAEAG